MPRAKVNKSQAIREYLSAQPTSMPKDVVAALAKNPIRASPQMVSMIKQDGRTQVKGPDRAQPVAHPKVLVDRVGSIGEAKRAVLALAKLL